MLIPDINLLIYAHNMRAAPHRDALAWWNERLNGHEGIGLPWVVILGFVRIATHPKVFECPMSVEEAVGRVEEWLALPHIDVLHPGDSHFATWSGLIRGLGSGGNLTTDVHLAALAIERNATLCSTDADFGRFSGLRWVNPLG